MTLEANGAYRLGSRGPIRLRAGVTGSSGPEERACPSLGLTNARRAWYEAQSRRYHNMTLDANGAYRLRSRGPIRLRAGVTGSSGPEERACPSLGLTNARRAWDQAQSQRYQHVTPRATSAYRR